jgi:hypothetical protein
MAAMRAPALAVVMLLIAGCGNPQGLGGPTPPLVTFQVIASGDLPPGAPPDVSLQVALVWGAQWWIEPFCILPPESDAVAAVIAAGCRDPFGFVPASPSTSVPVTVGTPEPLSLYALPSTDLLIGTVTSRVGYASLVLYDDRDGDGTLSLSTPHPTASGGRGPDEEDMRDSADIIYGASFLTMTEPDQRVAFLQGAFDPKSAFYPRSGCSDPPPDGFSVLATGGFSAADGLAASAMGTLPSQDPATCSTQTPDAALVSIPVRSPAEVTEVSCAERTLDGSTRYRQPPAERLDFRGRLTACAHLPSFGGPPAMDLTQLVVSGYPTDRCRGLTHYTLRGCRENVFCAVPDWDFTANPPAWWPCN